MGDRKMAVALPCRRQTQAVIHFSVLSVFLSDIVSFCFVRTKGVFSAQLASVFDGSAFLGNRKTEIREKSHVDLPKQMVRDIGRGLRLVHGCSHDRVIGHIDRS
jgi:hypothetical protein